MGKKREKLTPEGAQAEMQELLTEQPERPALETAQTPETHREVGEVSEVKALDGATVEEVLVGTVETSEGQREVIARKRDEGTVVRIVDPVEEAERMVGAQQVDMIGDAYDDTADLVLKVAGVKGQERKEARAALGTMKSAFIADMMGSADPSTVIADTLREKAKSITADGTSTTKTQDELQQELDNLVEKQKRANRSVLSFGSVSSEEKDLRTPNAGWKEKPETDSQGKFRKKEEIEERDQTTDWRRAVHKVVALDRAVYEAKVAMNPHASREEKAAMADQIEGAVKIVPNELYTQGFDIVNDRIQLLEAKMRALEKRKLGNDRAANQKAEAMHEELHTEYIQHLAMMPVLRRAKETADVASEAEKMIAKANEARTAKITEGEQGIDAEIAKLVQRAAELQTEKEKLQELGLDLAFDPNEEIGAAQEKQFATLIAAYATAPESVRAYVEATQNNPSTSEEIREVMDRFRKGHDAFEPKKKTIVPRKAPTPKVAVVPASAAPDTSRAKPDTAVETTSDIGQAQAKLYEALIAQFKTDPDGVKSAVEAALADSATSAATREVMEAFKTDKLTNQVVESKTKISAPEAVVESPKAPAIRLRPLVPPPPPPPPPRAEPLPSTELLGIGLSDSMMIQKEKMEAGQSESQILAAEMAAAAARVAESTKKPEETPEAPAEREFVVGKIVNLASGRNYEGKIEPDWKIIRWDWSADKTEIRYDLRKDGKTRQERKAVPLSILRRDNPPVLAAAETPKTIASPVEAQEAPMAAPKIPEPPKPSGLGQLPELPAFDLRENQTALPGWGGRSREAILRERNTERLGDFHPEADINYAALAAKEIAHYDEQIRQARTDAFPKDTTEAEQYRQKYVEMMNLTPPEAHPTPEDVQREKTLEEARTAYYGLINKFGAKKAEKHPGYKVFKDAFFVASRAQDNARCEKIVAVANALHIPSADNLLTGGLKQHDRVYSTEPSRGKSREDRLTVDAWEIQYVTDTSGSEVGPKVILRKIGTNERHSIDPALLSGSFLTTEQVKMETHGKSLLVENDASENTEPTPFSDEEAGMSDLIKTGYLKEGGDLAGLETAFVETCVALEAMDKTPKEEGLPSTFKDLLTAKNKPGLFRKVSDRAKLMERMQQVHHWYIENKQVDLDGYLTREKKTLEDYRKFGT